MDIVAKHIKADQDGVRIAQLDENTISKAVGITGRLPTSGGLEKGTPKAEQIGLYTMADIAKC